MTQTREHRAQEQRNGTGYDTKNTTNNEERRKDKRSQEKAGEAKKTQID